MHQPLALNCNVGRYIDPTCGAQGWKTNVGTNIAIGGRGAEGKDVKKAMEKLYLSFVAGGRVF